MQKLNKYSPVVLRYGITIVVLWFSIQQFLHTDNWVAYVPDGVVSMSHLSAKMLVYINASFEMLFGFILLLGLKTRISALLLSLHIFEIMYTVGYGEIGVRDFGLAVATFSVFMNGPDKLCLDYKNQNNTKDKSSDRSIIKNNPVLPNSPKRISTI